MSRFLSAIRCAPVLLGAAVAWSAPLVGQAPAGTVASRRAGGTVTIARVDQPPKLEAFSGEDPPDPPGTVTDFRQRDPGDGVPASAPTTVYLSYDDVNLYVVFVCKDDPAEVRAGLTKREEIDVDDGVVVLLDTFRDKKRAYLFQTNPRGVQLDGIRTEGQDDDYSFDAVWSSDARLTPDGYVVRIAIPFRSLRFPRTPTQTWGIALGRFIRRNNEESYWPYITKRMAGFVPQLATLEGLLDISPGRNLQMIPYGAFASARFLEADVPGFRTEAGHVRFEKACAREGAIGNHLQVASGGDIEQPLERRELRHESRHSLRDVRPVGLFVVATDEAAEGDPPALRRGAREAEAPERDGDADHIAVRREPRIRAPYGVEAVVVVLPFRADAVELDAARVRLEEVGALLVAECVQQNHDAVVDVDLLALGEAGPHLGRVVLADKDDVQVHVVVAQVDGGRRARRDAVPRVALAEVRHRPGGVGRILPAKRLELGGLVHSRNRHGPASPPAGDGPGWGLPHERGRPSNRSSEQHRGASNGAQEARHGFSPRGHFERGASVALRSQASDTAPRDLRTDPRLWHAGPVQRHSLISRRGQ